MKIVVLNAGSGSLKCSLFDWPETPSEPRPPDWEASIDATAPGQPEGRLLVMTSHGGHASKTPPQFVDAAATVEKRTAKLLRLLWEGNEAPLRGAEEIAVVGHRVVHGGDRYHQAVRIDEEVEAVIGELGAFAPLHNPANLKGIHAARELCGRAVQVAVFDTAFHRTLPPAAATYAGPYEWLRQGIRRYGFHGTSFRAASERAAQVLRRPGDRGLRLIICHLGGGCSVCATRGGESLDTTMGFTPLDGIAMCTRSGALDPGILIYLQRQGKTADEIETLLNKESGLKGLSGISGDTRDILPKAHAGDARAGLARDVFVHRLRAGIGQMLAALGDLPHAIVFTDAISEDEPELRAAACAPFAFLGVELDPNKNHASLVDSDLSAFPSPVKVLLIKSRESWQIARECHELLGSSP